jgi:hypothetical protein
MILSWQFAAGARGGLPLIDHLNGHDGAGNPLTPTSTAGRGLHRGMNANVGVVETGPAS